MPTDEIQLAGMQASLAADDYHLDYELQGDDAVVKISAGPDACAECLVPKPLMRAMLAPMLGVDAERIALDYPVDVHAGE